MVQVERGKKQLREGTAFCSVLWKCCTSVSLGFGTCSIRTRGLYRVACRAENWGYLTPFSSFHIRAETTTWHSKKRKMRLLRVTGWFCFFLFKSFSYLVYSVLSSQWVWNKRLETNGLRWTKTMFADLDYDVEEDKLWVFHLSFLSVSYNRNRLCSQDLMRVDNLLCDTVCWTSDFLFSADFLLPLEAGDEASLCWWERLCCSAVSALHLA